jgi:hypothetical protein
MPVESERPSASELLCFIDSLILENKDLFDPRKNKETSPTCIEPMLNFKVKERWVPEFFTSKDPNEPLWLKPLEFDAIIKGKTAAVPQNTVLQTTPLKPYEPSKDFHPT